MRRLAVLALLAGCAGGGGAPAAAETLRSKVDRWLAAALTAHRTRTHASGEHPAAVAEMGRIERELQAADRERVLEAIGETLVDLRDCIRDSEARRASILAEGRELTAEEQEEEERLAIDVETFRLSEELVRELRGKF